MLLICAALMASCSKGGHDPEPSSDASMRNFSFQANENAALENNCFSIGNGEIVYITVPENVPLNSLVPNFMTDGKATVTSGGTQVISGTTALDFSKTVTISVTAENGYKRDYYVLAKNGKSKIDDLVYTFMLKHSIPGVSVSISKDEELVYSAGYGFANAEKHERTTPDHLFRLASMSKQHAAIAIMTLYERGLLKLEDTVFGEGGILGEAFGNDMAASWKKITVEHLLSHTSGITTDCIFSGSPYSNNDIDGRISLLLSNANVSYTPGTTYSYNNSNFGILGRVVEEITKKKFMEFLKEEIYTPLGIEDIYAGGNNGGRDKEVNYYGQGGKNAYGNDVEAGVAAGGVIASTPALMKLMSYLDYGTKVPDMFKKETLDRMYTPLEGIKTTSGSAWDRYALGWRTNYPYIDNWTTYHGGTLAGVCTIWARGEDNVNGVVLCNSRSYDLGIDDDMWYMLEDIQNMFK